eukprot:TRINITY_DN10637_c0_g1_i2.p1 TRINITY_DN10637_c0_g1~~TRINITY_DN10637_c0_g1_i2.p1  ORF type:complete len:684 (-),score=77.93 TRINITY_DN10637_c0_g1_i2:99-2150(-)
MRWSRFITQLWLLTAVPSLSLAASCTTEDPSCHADNSFLQVGLTMSHDKGRTPTNNTQEDSTAVIALWPSDKELRTIVAERLMTNKTVEFSYRSLYATSEVGMAISSAVRSDLDNYGGRPRLTAQIDRDSLGDRVVYFPAAVLVAVAIYYAFTIAHEVYVGCFGGWPLLQNKVPQKSIGLQVLSLWTWMSMLMTTAVNIPLSLDYTMAMGMDPVLSGFFLSVGCITGIVGMILGRIVFDENKWSQRALRRWMIALTELSGLMGLVTFYCLQWVASKPVEVRRTYWWTMLWVSQIQVILSSSVGIPLAVVWNKCTPNRDKTFWTMLQQSTKMLGMALGPGVAALVIYGVQGDGERVSPVSMQAWMNLVIMALNLVSGLFSMLYQPVEIPPFDETTMEVIPPQSDPPRSPRQPRAPRGAPAVESPAPQMPVQLEPAPEEFEDKDRAQLVWHTLQFALERPLTVSAVEVATVMILEVEYGWPREATGIVFLLIACLGTVFAFVVAILVRRRSIRESYLVFTSGVISVCASLLLFDFGGSAGMWTLLCADPVLFTLALTSWGICEGWAARAVQPGKWYSIETFRMFDGLLMNLGRTIAPLIARAVIDMGGRNCYAAMQVLFVGLGFHSLRNICNLFWNLEKKQEEKAKQLKAPDKPKQEKLTDAVENAGTEASPETAPESTKQVTDD